MSASATDGDGNEVLPLTPIRRGNAGDQIDKVADKRLSILLTQHIIGDRGINTPIRTQFRHPVGVGKETHIYHIVGISGGTVLKTKGLDSNVLPVVR